MNLTCYRAFSSLGLMPLLLLGMLISPPSYSRGLADIGASGKLIVGVSNDVPLWGYRDSRSGVISGMEVDLAKNLADRMGVKLETIGMSSNERIDAVQSGRVDVLIADLSYTPERAELVTMVRPHYYSSGANLLSRKIDNFRDWTQLKYRKICGNRSAFYRRQLTVKYGVEVVALHSLDWEKRAFLDGRCRALISDDVVIITLLQQTGWSELFEMPLPSIFSMPWSVAISKEEAGGALDKLISAAIIDWHREGELLRLERKWGIPESNFVLGMRATWSKKDRDGSWHCGTEITATTPPECLEPSGTVR